MAATKKVTHPKSAPLAKAEPTPVVQPRPVAFGAREALAEHVRARLDYLAADAVRLAADGDVVAAHARIEDAIAGARAARHLGVFDSDGDYAECLYGLANIRSGLGLIGGTS
jgi:hypothetical protein